MTTRGEQTRERLLDAAEQLYGERGVEAVSLREIRLAAGQRNSSALQFHFGDRDGLLLALSQRHLPRITEIGDRLYAEVVEHGRQDDIAALVEVMVWPMVEYVRLGPSERAWVKISAELGARPETAWHDVIDHAPAVMLEVGSAIFEELKRTMPGSVALERILAVGQATHHLCADRARVEDSAPDDVLRRTLPFDTWSRNLVDMAVGATLAPVGTSTRTPGSSA